jgi:hypothetical protein
MGICTVQRGSAIMASRRDLASALLLLVLFQGTSCSAFLAPDITRQRHHVGVTHQLPPTFQRLSEQTLVPPPQWQSSTARSVWWFGNSDTADSIDSAGDSCELIAVRIEKPTSNSRKILGEVTVPVPLKDVWAILTDYDRLSVHVPNLVESSIKSRPSMGEQGDGSYSCRLYQRGAQKIIGFEFGASVTMDMQEKMTSYTSGLPSAGAVGKPNAIRQDANGVSHPNNERRILFKCVDSMFFSAFDGEWVAKEQIGEDGETETLLSYVVTVKPKGPVPVAALEWRIREDVPTNLRAVKAAAISVGYNGVMAVRQGGQLPVKTGEPAKTATATVRSKAALDRLAANVRSSVQWDRSETMASYLKE